MSKYAFHMKEQKPPTPRRPDVSSAFVDDDDKQSSSSSTSPSTAESQIRRRKIQTDKPLLLKPTVTGCRARKHFIVFCSFCFILFAPFVYNGGSLCNDVSATRAFRSLAADLIRAIAKVVDAKDKEENFVKWKATGAASSLHLLENEEKRESDDFTKLWTKMDLLEKSVISDMMSDGFAAKRLRAHNEDFPPGIHSVHGSIFVAIGYGLANVVIIETPIGLILFDALENANRMKALINDWMQLKNLKSKPQVVAIFYSHFHSDHVFGSASVVDQTTQIWSHESTATEIGRVFSVVAGTTYKRSMMQFGTLLDDNEFINAGIGPRLHYSSERKDLSRVIIPSHTWAGEQMTIEIGGVEMLWFQAPGESKDQTACWFPKLKVLFAADNVYKAFPNVYAIRGTESRDPMLWVRTIDKLRKFPAEYLVLGHTAPVTGQEKIREILTVYRDAIQYLHDQTVRKMNKGVPLDEIVQGLNLPKHLEQHPWLEPFYGTVEWTIRAVFNHYLGWFSGDSEDLAPLSKIQRATRMAKLAGGQPKLLDAAIHALEASDWQWALDLSSDLLRLDRYDFYARRVRILSLKALGSFYVSAPGRNWMLTSAKLDEEILAQQVNNASDQDFIRIPPFMQVFWKNKNSKKGFRVRDGLTVTLAQRALCIESLKSPAESLEYMSVRLNAEKAMSVEATVEFRFVDKGESTCVHIRRGVAYTAAECEKKPPSLIVETTDETWRKIISNQLSPVVAVSTGRFRLVPQDPLGYVRLKYIMSLVDFEDDNGQTDDYDD